ncbi:amidase signature enzyme [Artomyces pyxidatus]|uniref:Amidase signature enzyme n=1 Tax=Artomyces pyxidatus TaxID=48021 RepID=A0ACB8SNB4_9AGAM|nr:amidase signature enzyme [Artomyces pyxidatus]
MLQSCPKLSRSCRRPSLPTFLRGLSTGAELPWQHAVRTKNGFVNAIVHTASTRTNNADGPLNDVTVAVKDNICTADMPTTCASAMLRDFTSPFDATVVRLLQSSGATIVGKTNCDEFGMGSLNINSIHGPVVNPHGATSLEMESARHSAGGSSGGSAAAVAAGMCDAALGTDTGGSTRLPASYCGVVGLKPSYGMISRWGVVSFADSLDCVGVFGKDISSAQRVYDVLSAYDSKDPTAIPEDVRARARGACSEHAATWSSPTSSDLSGLKIGIPQEYFPSTLNPSIISSLRRTIRALQRQGATAIPVSLPNTSYALSAYYIIASAEASSNLARYDGVQYGLHVQRPPDALATDPASIYAHTRTAGFGPEVKKRILLGTYALTADAFDNYFLQAQRLRQLIREDFNRVFIVPDPMAAGPIVPTSAEGVHVLLHPSAICTAPPLEEAARTAGRIDTYVQDVLTVPASLAGLPAVSVPGGSVDESGNGGAGWPVGVSVVGQWGCEEMVMRVGKAIEDVGKESFE